MFSNNAAKFHAFITKVNNSALFWSLAARLFYSVLENVPVTIEAYMPGVFVKYIDNDVECLDCPQEDLEELFRKSQCLSHFSQKHIVTGNLIMNLGIQGAGYSLYDPVLVPLSSRGNLGKTRSKYLPGPFNCFETSLVTASNGVS